MINLDAEFLQEKIDKLNEKIRSREAWLKYAKEEDVRQCLYQDIYVYSLQRDMYFNLLKKE